MKLPSLLLLLVLAAVAAFTALNWNAIAVPGTISLGVTTLTAPLGIVLLGLLFFVTLMFFAYVLYLQTSTMLEARRHSRELQANRDLADKAESSRFTELRTALDAEMLKQTNLNEQANARVMARLDQLSQEMVTSVEQSGNTLAAYIGELEDRLETNQVALAKNGSAS